MRDFKFLQNKESGTIDVINVETRSTASLFAGLSRLPTPPSIRDYNGNYAAFNEAMRRYLRAVSMDRELSMSERDAIDQYTTNPPTTEDNFVRHIQRLRSFNGRMNDGGEIFARSAENSIVLKPKWWMRLKMKFQSIKLWMKVIDLHIFFMVIIAITLCIPVFYMLIQTITQK